MFNQTIIGRLGRVWRLDYEYLLADSKIKKLQEEHVKELLKHDWAEVLQDGRGYYVRWGQVENYNESSSYRLLVEVMLMNPMEANVGDVVYEPGFDAVFHPNKEATSWRFIPPLNVPSFNDVPSDVPGRIPKQIFERLSSGHWQRIS